jgi:hypothetical protein
VSLGLLYNQSPPGVRFLNKIIFYRMGLLAPCPTPILEELYYIILLLISSVNYLTNRMLTYPITKEAKGTKYYIRHCITMNTIKT